MAQTNQYSLDTFDFTGFEVYVPRRGKNATINKDASRTYLRFSRGIKSGHGKQVNQMMLSMSSETGRAAKEMFGDYCEFQFNPTTRKIAIVPGDITKLSLTKPGKRVELSVSSWFDKLVSAFGEHRRVYFDASVGDRMIVLTPTVEAD